MFLVIYAPRRGILEVLNFWNVLINFCQAELLEQIVCIMSRGVTITRHSSLLRYAGQAISTATRFCAPQFYLFLFDSQELLNLLNDHELLCCKSKRHRKSKPKAFTLLFYPANLK